MCERESEDAHPGATKYIKTQRGVVRVSCWGEMPIPIFFFDSVRTCTYRKLKPIIALFDRDFGQYGKVSVLNANIYFWVRPTSETCGNQSAGQQTKFFIHRFQKNP